jgi:hypothetical protein
MKRLRLPRLVLVGMTAIATAVLSSAPAMADASNWKLGYYTPSGRTLSFAESGNAGIASFDFTDQNNTALLVTKHGAGKGSTLGDLTGRTITATFDISGLTGAFTYFGEPDGSGAPSTTRFYFQTDNAGGFAYTNFWWSNPESQALVANGQFTLTATVEPAEWSDWNGQNGASQPTGFADAASSVTMIGLSFGGGYFFENGLGTTDGSGTFTLDSFTVS